MDQKPIVIMRPGTFTSVEGTQVSFSAADLAAIATSYDPSADPAPLVVGHPQLDAPAYGWAKALRMDGDRLVADPEKVEPAFAEAVSEGRYARISSSFYPPDHPANPKPGGWYLKHIGFLGGAAPAVKGLGIVQFREAVDQAPLATFETQEKNVTDKTVSLAEREAEIVAREAALNEREQAAAKAARDALHAANVSFAEGLVTEAKLAPAGKDLLVGVLDSLEAVKTVSFGEAGELAPAAALKKLLTGAKPLVSLGEAAPADKTAKSGAVSFAAPPGYTVDPGRAALYQRAKAIQASQPNTPWMTCVSLAEAEQAG